MNPDYDVVIAGYGPTGAVLSKLLGKGGLRVLVVDRSAEIFDRPRGIGMDHEALRILQFCDVAHDLFPHVRLYKGSLWTAADGTLLREFVPSPAPYPLGWPHNFTFLQPQFEGLLREHVAREPGVEVRLKVELTALSQDAGGVTATLRDVDSAQTTTVRTRYLIGSDGASSTVRAQLGIELEDLACDEWWIVLDALRLGDADFGDRNVQYCNPARPGTYVVGPGRLRRWEFRILPHENPDDFRNAERVLAMLREQQVDTSKLELWRSAVYRFHALIARRWHEGRVFLAGDAAHQTPPHLGQGLVSGLRDAMNLAWKILHVEAGASEAVFDDYMAEREPHFRSLVSTAKDFGNLIGILDPQRAAARDEMLRAQLARRSEPETRQNHIPSLVAGLLDLDDHGAPVAPAGQLFVQPTVRLADGDRLIDDGAVPRFQLFTAGIAPQAWLDEDHAGWWNHLAGERIAIVGADEAPEHTAPDGVRVLAETADLLRSWMARHGCQAAIVRPDRYVYGIASGPDALRRLVRKLHHRLLPDGAACAASLHFPQADALPIGRPHTDHPLPEPQR